MFDEGSAFSDDSTERPQNLQQDCKQPVVCLTFLVVARDSLMFNDFIEK